jgi:hypothetical protein
VIAGGDARYGKRRQRDENQETVSKARHRLHRSPPRLGLVSLYGLENGPVFEPL